MNSRIWLYAIVDSTGNAIFCVISIIIVIVVIRVSFKTVQQ